jgi:hypothetical protein
LFSAAQECPLIAGHYLLKGLQRKEILTVLAVCWKLASRALEAMGGGWVGMMRY